MENKDQITEIFDQQQKSANILRSEKIEKRYKRLKILRKWILDNREKIKKAIFEDFKKPYEETDVTEIGPCMLEINHAMKHLDVWSQPKHINTHISFLGTKAYIQYEPKGVCLIIAPWNYPFALAIGPLISALAAGNTCMMKPSEMTTNTSRLIKEMVKELYPEDIVAVFEGGVNVSQELMSKPFDHIFFTGSTTVGKIVMAAAAKNLSSVTLELGGKSPVIIDETASIDDAAKRIAWGKLVNNGQTCVAPDYLLVHSSMKDKLIDALKAEMERQFGEGGSAFKSSPSYARIVNKKHFGRLANLIDDALEKGAHLVYGGEKDENEEFLSPTILDNCPENALVSTEEIFGPLLTIDTYHTIDDAIGFIKKHPKPLSMYIFSKRRKNINYLLENVSAGGVCINDTVLQFAHPNLPFGGVNHSGIGKSHGRYGFIEFSNQKSVLKQKSGLTSSSILMPPYKRSKKFIDLFVNTILKWKL